MPGASLSRWTLCYFGCALAFLIAGEALMVAGFGYPAAAIDDPRTLILVHIIAIGWMSLLLCGALFQFVPVLVARPLWGASLALPALLLLLVGLVLLLLGFAGLGGLLAVPTALLPLGGAILLLGFGAVVVALAGTLWTARPWGLPAQFVAVGLAALTVTVILGNCFALVLAGLVGGEPALALLLHGVPLHAALGLGGWLTFTAMGVSYRLLAMFMLAPDTDQRSTRVVLGVGALALVLVAAAVPLAIAASGGIAATLLVAAGAALIALLVYGQDILRLYRKRKRRHIELNARAAIGAFGALALTVVLLFGLLGFEHLETGIGALVYLVVFGWLGGLGLAKLHKIVPFLTWLECFAPVLGKRPTPRVQDLVDEAHATPWFYAYYIAVALGTALLLVGWNDAFRLCAALQLVATLGIARHFYRARELLNVPSSLRDGFAAPHLFLSQPAVRKVP
ncbi:MAG TPA: hypothetical protein VL147_07615 [Devosia sp.]|nr:hypothetical protein [Devosia sp.]